MANKILSAEDVEKIKAMAREKLIAYGKLNVVIGSQIFHILENESKVLYYPLEDQKVWGFSETIKGKSFVCINTSLSYEKQVFVAAHELYHIWYGTAGEVMLSNDENEPNRDEEVELWANRFAAEFLVNEELLLQEMRTYGIDKNNIDIKDVLKLTSIFKVPYRTMTRRLREINVMYDSSYERLMSYAEKLVGITGRRMALSGEVRENPISLSNLVEKSVEVYEKGLITYERLEYLLQLSNLTPEDVGIGYEETRQPPMEEELDAIMEE